MAPPTRRAPFPPRPAAPSPSTRRPSARPTPQILDILPDEGEDAEGGATEAHAARKACVIKTSSRQTVYLPIPGLVDVAELKPGDLVGVNKDSHLILEKLPVEYDSRVKAMELDEKPTDDYSDVGGCDKQIMELQEAIVLPLTHGERFKKLGVRPPKGVLLYGPPGTGKTLLARACAKSTDAVFLKLAGPQLVQMYIGDGAKMVRDAFDLAREKSKDRGGACGGGGGGALLCCLPPHCFASSPQPTPSSPLSPQAPSSSSTRSTQWAASAGTGTRAAAARCSAPCWSCSTSWTASPATTRSR